MVENKIAALVITYNPDIEVLIRNLQTTEKNVGNNYVIVDNGSKNSKIIENISNGYCIFLGENKGIAFAQNVGFEYLNKRGYEWVILLDQDSQLPNDATLKMIKTREFNEDSTGIIGVDITTPSLKRKSAEGVIPFNELIASGSFIRMKAWINSGGMDNSLFIDFVDFDFNARVKKSGFNIYKNMDILMKHEIGDTIYAPVRGTIFLLKTRGGYFSDHSATRLYYYYRNSIIVKKRYPNFFKDKRNPIIVNILLLREILVYKKPKIKKIKFAIRGLVEGSFYRVENDKEFQKTMEKINA